MLLMKILRCQPNMEICHYQKACICLQRLKKKKPKHFIFQLDYLINEWVQKLAATKHLNLGA